MERIVIQVDDAIAQTWRNTSSELREKISRTIEKQISDILEKTKEANFDLILKEARKEAASKGLTEDILLSLLNEK